MRHRSAYAFSRSGPQHRSPAGALKRHHDPRPDPLLGVPPLVEGGLARHVRKLSEALVERDVEVHETYIHGIERWVTNRSQRVIARSHYMREQIADIFGVEEERITVISNGIDPDDLPVHDPDDLAEVAVRALSDDELGRRLVAEAYEHVRRFDWADVAEQTAAVYADLVGEASPA